MNINDFFFFKPQNLSKKKHIAKLGGTGHELEKIEKDNTQ